MDKNEYGFLSHITCENQFQIDEGLKSERQKFTTLKNVKENIFMALGKKRVFFCIKLKKKL